MFKVPPALAGLFLYYDVTDNSRLTATHERRRVNPEGNLMASLQNKVAVVTGASRGAGRAIALVLGDAGATAFVTGRTVRGTPAVDGLPGTIEDTAEEVTAR